MFCDSLTYYRSQCLIFLVFFSPHSSNTPKVWCIFQNSSLLVISRFQWLISAKGKSQMFDIIVPTKCMFFWNFDLCGVLQPGSYLPTFWVSPFCKPEERIFTAMHWTETCGPWLVASQSNDECCSVSHRANLCEQQWELSLPSGYAVLSENLSEIPQWHGMHMTLSHLDLKLWYTLISSCSKIELFSAKFE